MKKTINITEDLHKALKTYSAEQGTSIEFTLTRVLNDFFIRTGHIKSREIK